MNRAFVSLYLFIVLSVVFIGWGLNKFWESVEPDYAVSAEIEDLFLLLDQQLDTLPDGQQAIFINTLNRESRHRISLLAEEDIANTQFSELIDAGDVVLAMGDDDKPTWYKRDSSGRRVMVIASPASSTDDSILYAGLLVIFYLGIALVIFLWIWPLSKDLAALERQTRQIGRDGQSDALDISSRSTVFPLASAFEKMAQRIRELLGSHKEMTYAVSHELRTPLARMKFSLAMLESDSLNDAQAKQLKNVQQDIVEMEELISSLLLYAGFEQDSGKLDRRDGDMNALLNNMMQRLQRHPVRNVHIAVSDQSEGVLFNCEWKLMETVIQNLLNNALRFARENIAITLSVTPTDFHIAIDDDGPGIPVEERERVFESFVRLYSESPAQKGGFGLGLAIVKRILQWHEGDVRFTDSAYGGARVELHWPRLNR